MFIPCLAAPAALALFLGWLTGSSNAYAQYAPPVQPSCACGPSALPAYSPPVPVPQPAYRPLDYSPRAGVGYVEGRQYRPARTDLGATSYPPVQAPALWQGLYLGLNGGWGSGSTTIKDPDLGSTRTRGGLAGIHAGYNWQTGNTVFGLESDLSVNWMDGARTFGSGLTMKAQPDWSSSLRGRVGYATGNLLIYGTAGLALAGQTVTVSDPTGVASAKNTQLGWVAGAGAEMKLAPQMSLRGEVLHYRFGDKAFDFGVGTAGVKSNETVVRGGLTFHLN